MPLNANMMTVRTKTLLSTSITLGVVLTVLYLVLRVLLLSSFARLEQQDLTRNVERVQQAIATGVDDLTSATQDWSQWDDTYAFVKDHNAPFVRDNLTAAALATLRLNLLLIIDTKGRLVYGTGFDTKQKAMTKVPASVLAQFAPGSALLDRGAATTGHSGLLSLPEGVMLVSSQPILASDVKGPSRGSLVFGRTLDMDKIATTTRLTARVAASPAAPQAVSDAVTTHADAHTIHGDLRLRDVHNAARVALEVSLPRAIRQQAGRILRYVLLALVISGLASIGVAYLLVDRSVLVRLARLDAFVRAITTGPDVGARVDLPGNDELSSLADSINEMLAGLAQAEATIYHQAYHDVLTDIPNRTLFYERLHQAVESAARTRNAMAVLFVDVDRFKAVNDTLGHNTGDELLRQIADRLRRLLREGDTVGRLGGDEFAVLLPSVTQRPEVEAVAGRILEAIQAPFTIGERDLHITVSVGISLFPRDGREVLALLRNADIALYQAKDAGKNTYQFFTRKLDARTPEHLALETSLARALEHEEFALDYQPQFDGQTLELVGVEALLRWYHPRLGNVSPGQFIPIAEEAGLIEPIGAWALREACAQSRRWRDRGYRPLPVAVNLSAVQLRHHDFPRQVKAILAETGLPPDGLELELTEESAMADVTACLGVMRSLQAMGVEMSIDDFGMGRTSLVHLRQFPVRTVKIDRLLIRGVTDDPDQAAIPRAIIAMAHSLRLRVVAEGVETQAQLDFLRAQDCDVLQGYLLGYPTPPEEIERLLAVERARGRAAV